MSVDLLFWFTLSSLLITCLASIGARSLREFSRHDLEELCRARPSGVRFTEVLKHHDEVAVGIECLHVITTALFVASATFWMLLRDVAGISESPGLGSIQLDGPYLLQIAATTALSLLTFKIWIPWAVVRLWAAPFLFHTWRLWRLTSFVLLPLILAARFFNIVLHRLAGRPVTPPTEELYEDEIRTIVSDGHREGLFEEDAREMIEGVMELGEADVAKIMTPRTDMIVMSVDLKWPEVLNFVIEVGHTRIPVFDQTRDDIVGVLYAKDLLPVIKDSLTKDSLTKDPPSLSEVMRQPYFVPETKRLDTLLEEFQQTRSHMAVVLDEYGGVSGLVTMEDVLEEIVGEIVDEYDEELVEEIREIDDRTIEVLGRVHVDDLNERFGLSLPEEDDFDTIGGFVFSQLGHIPSVDEEVVWQDVQIQVTEASRRRIERVRIVLPGVRRETA